MSCCNLFAIDETIQLEILQKPHIAKPVLVIRHVLRINSELIFL